MFDNLKKYNIMLASKSPRRRELLQMLRIPFHVCALGGLDESYPDDMPTEDVPEYLSRKKAEAYKHIIVDNELIITADTLVTMDGKVFGKPKNRDEAVKMLMTLSGKTHKVITGVTVICKEKMCSFSCTTLVTFSEITISEAQYYVDNYTPFDKAGAYGIQEWIGGVAVKGIDGSFYNVMGLPVNMLFQVLKDF